MPLKGPVSTAFSGGGRPGKRGEGGWHETVVSRRVGTVGVGVHGVGSPPHLV